MLHAHAGRGADAKVGEILERIRRERLVEKAEAYCAESATNPAMLDQCADSISDLTAALDELESRTGHKVDDQSLKSRKVDDHMADDQSFLEGLQRLYGKRE